MSETAVFNLSRQGSLSTGLVLPGERPSAVDLLDGVAELRPWKRVELDRQRGGSWCVVGDVDGDGKIEVVSAQTAGGANRHYTASVAVQRLDGMVLWSWEDSTTAPAERRRELYHDVPCQIHDLDNDCRQEVVILSRTELIAFDGGDGSIKKRWPIPTDASDCLTFADLTGRGHSGDVLVKTRYGQVWAFDNDGRELWTHQPPAGQSLGHYCHLFQLDGNGRPSVLIGFTMLDAEGKPRWTYQPKAAALATPAHVDSAALLRHGPTPDETKIVLTGCNGLFIAGVTGDGRTLFERTGEHYESVQVGRDRDNAICILCDVDHTPKGRSPVVLFDEDGVERTRWITDYSRHHCFTPADAGMNGDLVALADAGLLVDPAGEVLCRLILEDNHPRVRAIFPADFIGRGRTKVSSTYRPDLLLTSWAGEVAWLFKRDPLKNTTEGAEITAPVGTGMNVTNY